MWSLGPKRLELLHELVPAVTVVAFIINPANPNAPSQMREVQAAAGALGIRLHVLHASSGRELELLSVSNPGTLKARRLQAKMFLPGNIVH